MQLDKGIYKKVETYYKESLELNRKLLTIEKDNPEFHSLYAITLFNQGKLYQRAPTYEKAENLFYESLSIYEKLIIQDPQTYGPSIEGVLSQIFFMIFTLNYTDLETREKAYLDILNKYQKLAKKNPTVYCTHYKSITFQVATNYEQVLNFKAAESVYNKASNICDDNPIFNKFVIEKQLIELYSSSKQLTELEKIYKNLQQDKNLRYKNKGVILDRLASMYSELNKFDKAEQYYRKELEYYKNNNQNNLQKISSSLIAYSYESLGEFYKKYQKFDQVLSSYEESLLIFRNLAKTNPNRYEGSVANITALLGDTYFESKQYEKAGILYQESIDIYKKIALIKPHEFMISLAATIDKYSFIYINSKEYKNAIKINKELLSVLKKVQFMYILKKTEFRSIEAYTLVRIGTLYQDNKQVENAEQTLMEALSLYEKLSKFKPNAYKKDIAFIWSRLGNLYKSKGENEKSKQYFTESLSLYRELAKTNPNIYDSNIVWTLNRINVSN